MLFFYITYQSAVKGALTLISVHVEVTYQYLVYYPFLPSPVCCWQLQKTNKKKLSHSFWTNKGQSFCTRYYYLVNYSNKVTKKIYVLKEDVVHCFWISSFFNLSILYIGLHTNCMQKIRFKAKHSKGLIWRLIQYKRLHSQRKD